MGNVFKWEGKKIRPHTPLGPLGLLTLAACGGGGGGGGGSTPTVSSPSSTTISGTAVAGPIDGAIAFVDYDEDGLLDVADEPYATLTAMVISLLPPQMLMHQSLLRQTALLLVA